MRLRGRKSLWGASMMTSFGVREVQKSAKVDGVVRKPSESRVRVDGGDDFGMSGGDAKRHFTLSLFADYLCRELRFHVSFVAKITFNNFSSHLLRRTHRARFASDKTGSECLVKKNPVRVFTK